MSTLTAIVILMKQMNPKNNQNVLTDAEYAVLLDRLGVAIAVCASGNSSDVKDTITKHLVYIASLNVISITDPTRQYDISTEIKDNAYLMRFYKQLNFHLFSTTTQGYNDYFVRVCNNVVAGLPFENDDKFSVSVGASLHLLAKTLYKKDLIDYFIKPSTDKMLRCFLLNHRHLVLQILIMQYYAIQSQ